MSFNKSWRKQLKRSRLLWPVFCAFGGMCRAQPPLPAAAASVKPTPPAHVRGLRQDAQAARIQWDFDGNSRGYLLYAAVDAKHPVFHRENEAPLRQTYVVWDAPRDKGTKFIFYVTALTADGHESDPSPQVAVDLSKRDPEPQ